ncbi:MAG: DUF2330 domain-containing protein [Planctomycetota bacterium]|nr:DUF2330 domain-containing protein [Planctomycetota bacterium]
MKRRVPIWWFSALAIVFVLPERPVRVDACCPVFRSGKNFRIADQRVLVAWDPQTKIEHFVRQAAFDQPKSSQPKNAQDDSLTLERTEGVEPDDFGFLVPSPSEPQIEEADAQVFDLLETAIEPRIQTQERWSVNPFPLALSPFLLAASQTALRVNSDAAPKSSVSVLQSKKVAGYEVAVLRASDADELVGWLKENHYEVRKDLQDWVEPYVQRGWLITAFKYDVNTKRTRVGSVRISFATDKPVFPYRVPKDQFSEQGRGNLLKIFVVGPGRASGILGQPDSSQGWNRGKLRFSMPMEPSKLDDLLGKSIPDGSLSVPHRMWLTAWDDPTWPSSDEDLWFDFDAEGVAYQEVRTVVRDRLIYLPIDVLGLLAIGAGLVIRRRRGR